VYCTLCMSSYTQRGLSVPTSAFCPRIIFVSCDSNSILQSAFSSIATRRSREYWWICTCLTVQAACIDLWGYVCEGPTASGCGSRLHVTSPTSSGDIKPQTLALRSRSGVTWWRQWSSYCRGASYITTGTFDVAVLKFRPFVEAFSSLWNECKQLPYLSVCPSSRTWQLQYCWMEET
jgi:hypothetical protein